MKFKDLDGLIMENASVSINTKSNKSHPIWYDSWAELKKEVLAAAWDQEVELTSYCGIQIVFINA